MVDSDCRWGSARCEPQRYCGEPLNKNWEKYCPFRALQYTTCARERKMVCVNNICQEAEDTSLKPTFQGKWISTNESDINDNLIYRSEATYNPPAARFRHYFIFENDGKCPSLQLAPNDAHYVADEDCSLEEINGQEIFTLGEEKFEVIERTAELLILKRL
jgi:hypothetical protein